jgi:hypothetical protein
MLWLSRKWRQRKTLDLLLRDDRPELASEVPPGVVESEIIRLMKKRDFEAVKSIRAYFPQVSPDYHAVQREYGKFSAENRIDLAQRLYDCLRIEPSEKLGSTTEKESDATLELVVLQKEGPVRDGQLWVLLNMPGLKKKFRRRFSAEECVLLEDGTVCYMTVPVLQKYNLIGHKIGDPYISYSDLGSAELRCKTGTPKQTEE